LVASAEVRNHKNVEEFIKKHIPQNSRVVGDEVYYYATINNNCKFQYMHLHVNELSQIEKYRREVFNYDYLIYSKRLDLRSKDTINYYMQHSKLIKIAELKTEKPKSVNFLSRLNIYSLSLGGYDGVIYKRIKN
jgi:hypothetical protein